MKKRFLTTRRARAILQTFFATLVMLIMVFPLYWMVITSFKTTEEVLLTRPTFWPHTFTLDAYAQVMTHYPVTRYLLNTLIVTAGILIIQVVTSILAAYGFSKGEFRGKNILFVLVLGAMMIPIQVTFIPIYVMISKQGLLNSYVGLILPEAASAYSIFLLRQSFMAVDNSYLEAAEVDGMGKLRVIFSILVPMCRPTVVTMTILAFINGWNAYFWPKMITTTDKVRTIALGIADIRNSFLSMEALNMNQIMAASCIAALPILVLFLVFQRYILTGFSKAAMK
ncbi:MAG: carbohydrate ABC transporter permease [Clostridiales bacterium]|nr:carbohydrate ABC transporter permease [Clostridiales bacterium]MDO4349271.1 carbohydrate ABC transporter permease [Eubacteriales bacterium]MDY4008652.1 carbohydrate ABC transporter permease [Candidatus Limiplasma sp.]